MQRISVVGEFTAADGWWLTATTRQSAQSAAAPADASARAALRRMVTGTELWNGNRERWRYLFRREESILRYAWTNHHRLRARYESAQVDPENAHLTFVRLRTREETETPLREPSRVS